MRGDFWDGWLFGMLAGIGIGGLLMLLLTATNVVDAAGACSSKELETVRLFNMERAKQTAIDGVNRRTLVASDAMCRAADLRCSEIQKKFSHYRPNGTYFNTALDQLGIGYERAGEIIARYYYNTPAKVVAAWMRSPSHRSVILTKRYDAVGAGWCGSYNHVTGEFIG